MISRRRFDGVFRQGIWTIVRSVSCSLESWSVSLSGCLQLERQLVRLDFDADDMGADEAAIVSQCGILKMLADGTRDESFDVGRRHPAHGSGPLSLSMEQG